MDTIKRVLTDFAGLEHRLEFVREFNGINFFNDSFAAAPSAPGAAMEAIKSNKIMIIFGLNRNSSVINYCTFMERVERSGERPSLLVLLLLIVNFTDHNNSLTSKQGI